jgi:hypothetical protein
MSMQQTRAGRSVSRMSMCVQINFIEFPLCVRAERKKMRKMRKRKMNENALILVNACSFRGCKVQPSFS